MALAKIVLVGSTPFFETTLRSLLEDSGFEVLQYGAEEMNITDLTRLDGYDLCILSSDLVPGIDERESSSAASSSDGFILMGAKEDILDPFSGSTTYIEPQMSPEEIILKVNNIVFKRNKLRKSPRVKVKIEVEYEYENTIQKSEIITVSLYGVFIRTLNPPPRDCIIKILFSLPGDQDRIEADGRVLYGISCDLERGIISHPDAKDKKIIAFPGMGVFFEKISDADQQKIGAFIEEHRVE